MSAVGLHCNPGLVAELDASRSITVSVGIQAGVVGSMDVSILEKQQAI